MTKAILGASFVLLLFLVACSSDTATRSISADPKPQPLAVLPALSEPASFTPIPEEYDEEFVSNDSLISIRLEQARLHYLSAAAAAENGDSVRSAMQFEESIAILNELSYYPEIDSNQDFTDLSRTVIEDYEQYIAKSDVLDPEASVFALREKLNQATEGDSLESSAPKLVVEGTTIPLEVNHLVEQSIAFFQGKGRIHMERWIERSGKYFPTMKRILKEEGVPEEIIYLSMVESGLNPVARSWAKAVGLWQFMKGTGKLYGLQANYWFDERRDFEKATRAAARHLKDLHEEFGDWYLALAGYNSGAGRVYRGIRRSGTTDYWAMRRHIPRETRGYVPQYIAVTLIAMNPEDFGFGGVVPGQPFEYEYVSVDDCVDLEVLANCAGTTEDVLRELNPELVQWCTPPGMKGYQLRVPKGSTGMFAANYANIPDSQKRDFITHTVRRGETLRSLAANYGISAAIIRESNNLRSTKRLAVGKTLVIPVKHGTQDGASIAALSLDETPVLQKRAVRSRTRIQKALTAHAAVRPVSVVAKGKSKLVYKVRKGDTIGHISEWYGCRAADIRNWNDIPYGRPIIAGTDLVIWVDKNKAQQYAHLDQLSFAQKQTTLGKAPLAGNRDDATPDGATRHIVKPGESLDKIARANNVSVKQLLRWNKLSRGVVVPDQVILVYPEARELPSKSGRLAAKSTGSEQKPVVHIVRKGDTLWQIAKIYNVDQSKLIAWNDLKRHKIYTGQELIIYRN